jgi:diaminopimelate epimerase
MKPARYVILDPTGNLTALVLDWDGADEAEITTRLMTKSEQVAYLEAPTLDGAIGTIRLMGGEFCGNAAMAAAGWLSRDRMEPEKEMTVPIQVSGAGGLVFCRVKGNADGSFTGTAEMPRVLEIREEFRDGEQYTAVRMEGILHLIREGGAFLERAEAERRLREAAAERPEEEAIGLMDRNPETGETRPLVYVRGSGTTVWETACGSGSAAIGAAEARKQGKDGIFRTEIRQPGGVIRAEAEAENGRITAVRIAGTVRMGEETELRDGEENPG